MPLDDQLTIDANDISGPTVTPVKIEFQFIYTQQSWQSLFACQTTAGAQCSSLDLAYYFAATTIFEDSLVKWMEADPMQDMQRAKLHFKRTFLLFRRWTVAMGLTCNHPEYGLLTEECLGVMCADALIFPSQHSNSFHDIFHSRIFQQIGKPETHVGVLGGPVFNSRVHPDHMHAFSQAIKTLDPQAGWRLWRDQGGNLFLNQHQAFIKHEACCWDPRNKGKKEGFAAYVKRSNVELVNQLRGKWSGSAKIRFWPRSLKDERQGEYVYVIGISLNAEDPMLRGELAKRTPGSREVDEQGDMYYRTATRISREEVVKLFQEDPIVRDFAVPQRVGEASESSEHQAGQKKTVEGNVPSEGRFRTAAEVMNRLRHDEKHMYIDYEVGYEDRFEKALKWKALDKWEKHTEEEEFIPEHRIQQVREKNGAIVWDRKERTDRT